MKKSLLKKFDRENLLRLFELCDWVWEKPIQGTAIRSFEFEGNTYLLPEENLSDLVLFEYGTADLYFREFTKAEPNLKALDLLIATVCRPEKKDLNINDPAWDGDRRERYHSKIAERRAMDFSRLPINVKMVVLQSFIAGQRTIHQDYKEIFVSAKGGGTGSSSPDFGWIGLVDDLAEQSIFGDWEKTAYTNLHLVLFHLKKKHYQLKEIRMNS